LVNSKDAFAEAILKPSAFLNRFLKRFIRLKWFLACHANGWTGYLAISSSVYRAAKLL
jgi:hypothetical protein